MARQTGLGRALEIILSARDFDADEAEALGMPEGSPALIIERHYRSDFDGIPYLIARSVCRADLVKLASRFVTSS